MVSKDQDHAEAGTILDREVLVRQSLHTALQSRSGVLEGVLLKFEHHSAAVHYRYVCCNLCSLMGCGGWQWSVKMPSNIWLMKKIPSSFKALSCGAIEVIFTL